MARMPLAGAAGPAVQPGVIVRDVLIGRKAFINQSRGPYVE